jgi:AhpD family alkylhydroperoxidase
MSATPDPDDAGRIPDADDAGRRGAATVAAAALGVHLLVHAAHGVPHATIPVGLPAWLLATVVLTTFVLPVVGVVLLWRGPARVGAAVFAGSMAAAFVVAGVLHFVVSNPDHVTAVPAGPWRLPFQATAAAMALVDAVGVVVGVRCWRAAAAAPGGDLPRSGRIDGVPASGFRPLTRLSYWVSRRWFGEVPEPLTVTAHHGPVFLGVDAFEAALDRADRVDEGLKEPAVVKTATLVGCAFCVDIGSALAADHGVEARKLRDIGDFESSDAFSDRERLVLRYAVATTTTPADVPEDLFEAMTAEFDDAELVELTAAVAFENYRARFNHALGIEAQGFAEGAACPRPRSLARR